MQEHTLYPNSIPPKKQLQAKQFSETGPLTKPSILNQQQSGSDKKGKKRVRFSHGSERSSDGKVQKPLMKKRLLDDAVEDSPPKNLKNEFLSNPRSQRSQLILPDYVTSPKYEAPKRRESQLEEGEIISDDSSP